MTSSRVLFWHRRDLRLADNLGLVAATDISPAVTGVYVLDPQLINPPDHLPPMAPARLWFLICLLYTSPSPRDGLLSRMPSSA